MTVHDVDQSQYLDSINGHQTLQQRIDVMERQRRYASQRNRLLLIAVFGWTLGLSSVFWTLWRGGC